MLMIGLIYLLSHCNFAIESLAIPTSINFNIKDKRPLITEKATAEKKVTQYENLYNMAAKHLEEGGKTNNITSFYSVHRNPTTNKDVITIDDDGTENSFINSKMVCYKL